MVAKVLVGNLPVGTSTEELDEELKNRGWPVENVIRVDEGNPEKLLFIVETSMDVQVARRLSESYGYRLRFKGRRMTMYVPLVMQ